jgi:hypothetical protein
LSPLRESGRDQLFDDNSDDSLDVNVDNTGTLLDVDEGWDYYYCCSSSSLCVYFLGVDEHLISASAGEIVTTSRVPNYNRLSGSSTFDTSSEYLALPIEIRRVFQFTEGARNKNRLLSLLRVVVRLWF